MVIIVTFFKQTLDMEYKEPLDILYLGAGALGIALALYFTHKEHNANDQKHPD